MKLKVRSFVAHLILRGVYRQRLVATMFVINNVPKSKQSVVYHFVLISEHPINGPKD